MVLLRIESIKIQPKYTLIIFNINIYIALIVYLKNLIFSQIIGYTKRQFDL